MIKGGTGRRTFEEFLEHNLKDKIGIIDVGSEFNTNFVSNASPVCVEMNLTFHDPFVESRPFWKRIFDTKWKKQRRIENFRSNLEKIRKEMGIEPLVISSSYSS